MKFDGVRLSMNKNETCILKEEEYIVGVKLGVRESTSIVSI